MGETYTGLSGKTKEDFGHGNAKFVTYMNVFSNSIADLSMTESVEIDKKQNEVNYGDVFFTTSSETPDEVGMSSVWLENSDNTYLNSFCFGYRPSVKVNPYYMAYMLRSDNVRKNIVFLAQGISRYNISKNKMMEISVPLPNLEEQQKIGEYFRHLDALITLHQREYFSFDFGGGSAKNVQKTLSWEQRKVGDVLSESRDAGHSGDIAKKLTVKLWGKGVYAKNDKGSAATQYFTRHAGQFIYSKLDFLNSAFGVVPQELESYESTADLPAFDCIAVDPYFMFYRAIQPSFYLTNGMIADGSRKAKRIHVETFLDMPLDLPSIEEQKKVASYFTQLDSLITLHQRKLETLQKMKKSLLQKMFV